MADRFIPEHRRTNFKAKGQFKPEELRRRREEQQVEIRKQKREENLAKRRNLQITSPVDHAGSAGAESDEDNGSTESQVCLHPFFLSMLCHPALCTRWFCCAFAFGGVFCRNLALSLFIGGHRYARTNTTGGTAHSPSCNCIRLYTHAIKETMVGNAYVCL